MQAVRGLRPLLLKSRQVFIQRNYAKKKKKDKFPKVTLNDLPNPEGDWFTEYNKRQKTYNLHLVLGIGFLAFSIAVGVPLNQYQFYNHLPEEMPEIECYK
ncbi:hypothetical protein Zmor_025834 [Zophobas morio]|uniref:Deltamethrin resistance protein prag01 domain-containing protein n=1 Tax=Zophobas morio TaxID=2755281 RepID=A0AA38M5G5_9CUCU|nr:hypothetical protein Zmor_025834 [Zophobas morio]